MAGESCAVFNNRPTTIGDEYGTGLNIQDMIRDVTIGGPVVNAYTQQSALGRFVPVSGKNVTMMFVDGRYFGTGLVIGLYDGDQPLNRFPVFIGGMTAPGDRALIKFQANGFVTLNGNVVATGFDSCFGIYMEVWGGTPLSGGGGDPFGLDWEHFTDDTLCPFGGAQIVAYRGNGRSILDLPGRDVVVFKRDMFFLGFEVQPCIVPPPFIPADLSYNEAFIVMTGVTKWNKLRYLTPKL
jgi:hypothetical protein